MLSLALSGVCVCVYVLKKREGGMCAKRNTSPIQLRHHTVRVCPNYGSYAQHLDKARKSRVCYDPLREWVGTLSSAVARLRPAVCCPHVLHSPHG